MQTADIAGVISTLKRQHILVDDSALTKSLYSSDASVYRIAPLAVAFPRETGDIDAIVAACRDSGVPITSRGAGTSIAGNAIGGGVIIDHSRYLNSILDVDAVARSARVQPGVVHATLQERVAREGLRFEPDPSSHSRCTISGMIGNNACGSRALGYGRTSDNVLGLRVVTASGEHLRLGSLASPNGENSPVSDELHTTVMASLGTIRTQFGRFSRQVSGYALEHLLPERGFDVSKSLVGSEGTLGIVVEADVRLVRDAAHRIMVVLGFADMVAAAADVPAILAFSPVACEGLDRRITDVVRAMRGPAAVPPMPRGRGWLFVELAGENAHELDVIARAVATAGNAIDSRVVRSAAEMTALWKIREDGSGLVARTPSGRPSHAGWEDAAVPPEHLSSYLSRFEELLSHHGYLGVPYGEGVGKVGRHLVDLLVAEGARVVVSDPVEASIQRVAGMHGARVEVTDSVLSAEVDVYAPCALGGTLDLATVSRLRAAIVCGAANNQLATPDVDEALLQRGVTWVPDYVANAGGLVQLAASSSAAVRQMYVAKYTGSAPLYGGSSRWRRPTDFRLGGWRTAWPARVEKAR